MMHRRTLLAGLTLAVAAASTPIPAEAQARFEMLGTHTVNFGADRDVIRLSPYEGTFRGIQLRVKRHGIEFFDLKVVYGNGEVDDVPVRRFIAAGGETRLIDLRGGRRFIREVRMVYRTVPNFSGAPAIVEVWGLR